VEIPLSITALTIGEGAVLPYFIGDSARCVFVDFRSTEF
jgi:hypothetical protein